MKTDEDQIRNLVRGWMQASTAGDVDTVLGMMTEDVVFLVPGQPPMHKQDFAALARAQASPSGPRFDGASDIQEIQVIGEWAFLWSRLKVVATHADGSPAITRDGHTLSILTREQGRWLLARDANLLGPARHTPV